MTQFHLKVKLLPGAKFVIGSEENAGYDLYSMEQIVIEPGVSRLILVGIMTEFPPDWVGLIQDRSSMGIKGIMRQAGVIDSGFRGEWGVKLYNTGFLALHIESIVTNPNAKAIAQVVFVPRGKETIEYVDELSESLRGANWKGSTDVRN